MAEVSARHQISKAEWFYFSVEFDETAYPDIMREAKATVVAAMREMYAEAFDIEAEQTKP